MGLEQSFTDRSAEQCHLHQRLFLSASGSRRSLSGICKGMARTSSFLISTRISNDSNTIDSLYLWARMPQTGGHPLTYFQHLMVGEGGAQNENDE